MADRGASARIIRRAVAGDQLSASDGNDSVLHGIRARESGAPLRQGQLFLVLGLALNGLPCDISTAVDVRRRAIETRGRKSSKFYSR